MEPHLPTILAHKLQLGGEKPGGPKVTQLEQVDSLLHISQNKESTWQLLMHQGDRGRGGERVQRQVKIQAKK